MKPSNEKCQPQFERKAQTARDYREEETSQKQCNVKSQPSSSKNKKNAGILKLKLFTFFFELIGSIQFKNK